MRKRAKFNLSNFHNCTMKMGFLYPVGLQEVLPGDTIQQSTSVFLRFAPMVAPVMHPTYLHVYHFFVPSRLCGEKIGFDFESFITGGKDGMDTTTIPKITITKDNASGHSWGGSLFDAFGIPVQNLKEGSFKVNSLPFVAYRMIWNEYFRDQDLNPEQSYDSLKDGVTPNGSSMGVHFVSWKKDYFTTARPWPQKGPEVTIPVKAAGGGITGNVTVSGSGTPTFSVKDFGHGPEATSSTGGVVNWTSTNQALGAENSTDAVPYGLYVPPTVAEGVVREKFGQLVWKDPGLKAAFTSTTPEGIGSIDLSDLREGFAIQRFEEQRALYGSRYEDLLRSLGVRPQDSRLQMPEYLGGFSSPVQFSEVLQTSADDQGGVGDLYGHGIAAARGRRIRRFIPEHGYVLTLMVVRPIAVYSQGLERLWSKTTKYDFWTKDLEHIGQQEVLSSEVYADGTEADGNIFGYQNRYDEYRRGVSIVTGEFRTNQDFWTLARIFDSRPALNGTFVDCHPSDRIFQVGENNSDQIYAMIKNNVVCRRLISRNGNPM